MVTQLVIDQYVQLKEELGRICPECIEEAEQLANEAQRAGDLAPDAYWDLIWGKPIWANNRVENAQRKIDDLRPLMTEAWRHMGASDGPFEIRLTGRGHWTSVAAHNVIGRRAREIDLAPHRLFAIVGAGKAFGERRNQYGVANPFQDIFELDMTELEEKMRIIKGQFGRGWGYTTVLHFLTDLGMACKPDLHLCRTIAHLGFGDNLEDRITFRNAIRINLWVMCLARGAEGALSPYTLRYTDKILMEISRQGLIDL